MTWEIPCPPSIRPRRSEVRTYARSLITDWEGFAERDICGVRALAAALRARGGKAAEANAKKLDAHALWLDSIEALKGEIGRGW